MAHWQANPVPGVHTVLTGQQHQAAQQFMAAADTVADAVSAGDLAGATARLAVAHGLYAQHRAGVEATVKAAEAHANAVTDQLVATQRGALQVGVGILAAVLVGLLAVGQGVARGIRRATGGEPALSAEVARTVAQGDLRVQVPVAAGDNSSAMAAMAHMCSTLATMVGDVRSSSDLIASSAHQIAAGNLDLSRRTEQQAANLQQTASSMAEFSTTVQSTAAAAGQTTDLAQSACAAARHGAGMVNGVVHTMNDIRASAKRIAEITSVIDGIAFQTNILALNAAVEAARAGEQGRGFAVVASEVRALAQRSARAAKEIGQLIGQSVDRGEHGARQVADAGNTMADIVGQVEAVGVLIQEIDNATQAQSSGITVVGRSVHDMDSATQQNVALVEQAAAAAAELGDQADRLRALVGRFQLPAHAA